MVRTLAHRTPGLPEGTYVELVRSVFATLIPTTIMGILFVVVAGFALRQSHDSALHVLSLAGTGLSLARVALLLQFERADRAIGTDKRAAERAEAWFAPCYLAFALTLGVFAARVTQIAPPGVQLVTVALIVGYSAGVAAGVSLRPWIALPSVVIAVGPTVMVALAWGDAAHRLLGFVLGAFVAEGASSMVARFRSETEKIAMRRAFETSRGRTLSPGWQIASGSPKLIARPLRFRTASRRCIASISIGSRQSTTGSAIRSATRCSRPCRDD